MPNAGSAPGWQPGSSAALLSEARWQVPAITMDRATAMVMDMDTAVRPMPPMAIMAVASGSGSVSGTVTAGGFGESGFAADPFILIKSRAASSESTDFSRTAASNGLKKTFFQATSPAPFTLDSLL